MLAVGGTGAGYALSRPSLLDNTARGSLKRINASSTLPADADVVIVGGGLVGIATAMPLVEKGLKVVVCEKGVVGAEQSSRAFGWISTLGDKALRLSLSVPSKSIWKSMQDRLDADPSYREVGLMFECADDEAIAHWEDWAKQNAAFGGDTVRIIKGDELAERLPAGTARPWHAAVLQPTDGSIEPNIATPTIAEALVARGLTILENCAVRGIETSNGAVSSVVTEKGEISCKAVVVAGGAWSHLFLKNLGVDTPILKLYSSIQRVKAGNGPVGLGVGSGAVWRREQGGTYSLGISAHTAPIFADNLRYLPQFLPALQANSQSVKIDVNRDSFADLLAASSWSNDEQTPFEKTRILAAKPDQDALQASLDSFRDAFPGASDAAVVESWAGVIDTTPDTAPIVQKWDPIPGLVLAVGFSGHGLSMAPAAGQLAAELVMNETSTIVDPGLYNMNRF